MAKIEKTFTFHIDEQVALEIIELKEEIKTLKKKCDSRDTKISNLKFKVTTLTNKYAKDYSELRKAAEKLFTILTDSGVVDPYMEDF